MPKFKIAEVTYFLLFGGILFLYALQISWIKPKDVAQASMEIHVEGGKSLKKQNPTLRAESDSEMLEAFSRFLKESNYKDIKNLKLEGNFVNKFSDIDLNALLGKQEKKCNRQKRCQRKCTAS